MSKFARFGHTEGKKEMQPQKMLGADDLKKNTYRRKTNLVNFLMRSWVPTIDIYGAHRWNLKSSKRIVVHRNRNKIIFCRAYIFTT
jgi:hypothetical protein